MKTTQYFQYTRLRPDRAPIKDEWIEQVVKNPLREERQSDGRKSARVWLGQEKCKRCFAKLFISEIGRRK